MRPSLKVNRVKACPPFMQLRMGSAKKEWLVASQGARIVRHESCTRLRPFQWKPVLDGDLRARSVRRLTGVPTAIAVGHWSGRKIQRTPYLEAEITLFR